MSVIEVTLSGIREALSYYKKLKMYELRGFKIAYGYFIGSTFSPVRRDFDLFIKERS